MRSTTIIIACLLVCILAFFMHGCKKTQQDTRGLIFSINVDKADPCLYPGDVLQFSMISSKPLEANTQYQWNFGDGVTSTLQSPQHTYHSAGTYGVTLMVNGNSDNAARRDIRVNSLDTSAYTSLMGGSRMWYGFRTTWYDDSTLISDSSLAIEVLDGRTVRFADLEMKLSGTDTTNREIGYASCTESATLRFYYGMDSFSYSYRKQTGKLNGIVIEMHTQ